jgi:Ca2+-binding EF-hand superfamily protein
MKTQTMTFSNSKISFHLLRWFSGLSLILFISNVAPGQEFNLEGYLKKKDTNQNGRVEPEELSNNARGILKKMGFDDKKSNSISRIVAKANRDKKAMVAKSNSSKNARTRKTEGFGVEKSATEGVSRFGGTADAKSSTARGKSGTSFSASVLERVESTLKRYDRNKNGSLDQDEIRRARWGSPAPEQNDTNKDGRLSRQELSVRYASREQMYSRSKSSRAVASSSKSSTSSKAEDDRARRAKEREKFRNSGSKASSTSSSSRRSSYRPSTSSAKTSSTKTSSSSSSSAQAKYERYATSLVDSYDTDKDGKLSKEETKKMRRPPAGADIDKDGFITKSELIGSLSGTNKKSAATATSAKESKEVAKDKSKSKYSRDRSKTSRSRTSSRTSSSFDKLDANADKQVQMHEFADKWTDELVKEFYEKDRNGDGVITIREWSGK